MSASARAKLALSRYGPAVAAALVLLGLAALGGAVLTYTSPSVEQVTEETNRQSVATEVRDSAVVTNGTALYEEGQVLRDMPVYFSRATPNLTLRVRTSVPSGQEVAVSQRLLLSMRAVRGDEQFFSQRRVVTAGDAQVSSGVVWSNATMNMTAVRAAVNEKSAAVGGVGTLQVVLRLQVTYETNRYEGSLNATAPLVFTEGAYFVDGELAASRSHSTTVTRRVTRPPDMTTVGGLAVLGLGLIAGAVVVLRRYREIDHTTLETELARSRYDEWISNGEMPTKSEKDYVRTDSLEDLVDVAIDSNNRVIYDRSLDAYAVVQGDLVYYFAPDEAQLTDWFDV